MCGVTGVFGRVGREEAAALVARMNQVILHRGPDDEGSWAGDGFAFGMRRLSIIDLAGGHQPIWTDDGVGIVFNGEIYNYQALRNELIESGYSFHTHSDTEVILKLYHRDGLEAINRLQGMFAICLYDPRQNVMHLVRDRLGVKPLYYGRLDGRFYFASEIKAILAVLSARPPLNRQALHHYLTFRFVPSPQTIWEGIFKLEPATWATFDLGTGEAAFKRYWHAEFDSQPVEPGRDYVAEFENLFLAAVEKRLLASDVPVGVLLSGGLDSSAISAAAVELGHRDFHTFSVGFRDGGTFDESGYAREVARHVGSRHHEVFIGRDEFMDFLPELVRFTDEPIADLAAVPLYFVSRLARQDVKVVLSGEGSDETLAGYDFERVAFQIDRLRRLDEALPSAAIRLAARLMPSGHYRRVLANLAAFGWRDYLAGQRAHITYHWTEAEKAVLWRGKEDFGSSDALIDAWYREAGGSHPLDRQQQVYCRQWLVEDLLMKADKMSMATSLELRVPFLDHALVEWAARLPLAWKVGDRGSGPISKRVLREFARKRLPAGILTRPKQGFPVPAYRWLQDGMGEWAKDFVMSPSSRIGEYFDTSHLQPVLAAARGGDIGAAHKIWIFIIAEQWCREWL